MYSQKIFIEEEDSVSMIQDLPNSWKELGQNETGVDAYLSQFFNQDLFHGTQSLIFYQKSEVLSGKPQGRQDLQKIKQDKSDLKKGITQDLSKEEISEGITENNKKTKRQRPSDHNICKKFHSIANKCLKKLGLYKLIQPECRKIHKRNYFILVLIIADKAHRLKEFKQIYTQKINIEIDKYKESVSSESTEQNHNHQTLDSIECSLSAINLYEKGLLHEAVQKLFNVEKLKRQGWIEQAFLQVSQFGERIQLEIERVLTRF